MTIRKRPSLQQLQDQFNMYAPKDGLAWKPKFMDMKPRAPRITPNRHDEADLQVACCQFLNLHPRILYWATPNSTWIGGEMTGAKMGYLAKQKRMGVRKGVPDICLLFRNKNGATTFCFAELKTPKGSVTEEQDAIMDKANGLGAYTAVVRSIEDLQALLNVAGYQ